MSNNKVSAKAFQDWPTMASDPSTGAVVKAVVEDAILRGDIATVAPAPAAMPTQSPPAPSRPRGP